MFRRIVLLCSSLLFVTMCFAQQPSKPVLPWKADRDMQQLQGKWKRTTTSGFRPDQPEMNKMLVDALVADDALLEFANNQLTFAHAKITTTAKNDGNKADEVFKHGTFSNTDEPYLVLTPKDGKPMTVSYIVGTNGLSIRYPARSCSRSGLILHFTRVTSEMAK